MQIILLEQVQNLGRLGDIVNVKGGYARNFLIPQGKAKQATEINIAEFETRRSDLEAQEETILTGAKERSAKVDGLSLQIAQKAGVDGRLFGSVTHYDIAASLLAQGHEVPKNIIQMPGGPLKRVGDYPITVYFHADAIATINVSVVGEQ
jgi:large subunit ribosomal protein L9